MPKHVASQTLTDLTWNARPLQGDAAEAVAEQWGNGGGPPQVRHRRVLADADRERLLDELHVWIFPVLVGGGQRLIDGIDVTHLEPVESTPFGSGIVVNAYAPKG